MSMGEWEWKVELGNETSFAIFLLQPWVYLLNSCREYNREANSTRNSSWTLVDLVQYTDEMYMCINVTEMLHGHCITIKYLAVRSFE